MFRPGRRFQYSDVGYILLGDAVERRAGQPLDVYARQRIFDPLELSDDTAFKLPATAKSRVAPTTERNGGWIRGQTQDPRAWRLGGVAGNAGLFSTAGDLTDYARAFLNTGQRGSRRVLKPSSLRRMTTPHRVGSHVRGLGWELASKQRPAAGWSRRSFGHGGYTGTSMWIDPAADRFVIFLSNRVHPDGRGNVHPLVHDLHKLAAEHWPPALRSCDSCNVLTGADVLVRGGFRGLRDKRVGLISNISAQTRGGLPTWEQIHKSVNVALVRVFTPEHGLEALGEGPIRDTEALSGVEVVSLFGENRAPTSQQLKDLDVLVFDLPDVGARFFTYASTLHAAIRAAAQHRMPLVVLDRPNPLGGVVVRGPVLALERYSSFVNHFSLPVRHGMTMGELARFIAAKEELSVDLRVMRVENWKRRQTWSDIGLRWVPPSPNLSSIDKVFLYPGLALIEGTNVSVGRGTPHAFEVVGAPWMKRADKVVTRLKERSIPGVDFASTRFVPKSGQYRGKTCNGIRVRFDDVSEINAVQLGFEIAAALRDLYPRRWDASRMERMVGHRETFQRFLRGTDWQDLRRGWADDLKRFRGSRRRSLLY